MGNMMNIKNFIMLAPLVLLVACAQDTAAPNAAGADTSASSAAEMAAVADTDPTIQARLATADASMGQRQFIYCQACHSVEADGSHKVGPNLSGVFGRPAAQSAGFIYSAALSESGITWDAAAMDAWIASPAAMVPGTIMVFAGVPDPQQRANLIAYLQQVTASSD
jgi:cytochrome c